MPQTTETVHGVPLTFDTIPGFGAVRFVTGRATEQTQPTAQIGSPVAKTATSTQADQSTAGTPAGTPAFHCTGPVVALVRFPNLSKSITTGKELSEPSPHVVPPVPRGLKDVFFNALANPNLTSVVPRNASSSVTASSPVTARRTTSGSNIKITDFSGEKLYLGTCEQSPVQSEEAVYLPVYDDISTSASPRDREYVGSNETIVLSLNRFNYNILNKILSIPRHGRVTPGQNKALSAGQNGHLDRGSLVIGQGLFFELWLINTYFGSRFWKQSYADMPAGTYYPFCTLAANQTPKQGAGVSQIRMLAIEANWNYNEELGKWIMKASHLSDLPGAAI